MLNWLRKLEVRRPGGPRKCFVPGSMDAFHSRVYLEKEKGAGPPKFTDNEFRVLRQPQVNIPKPN